VKVDIIPSLSLQTESIASILTSFLRDVTNLHSKLKSVTNLGKCFEA
jgi:hypothetical protein